MRTIALSICLAMGCDALGSEQDQRDLIAKMQEVREHMHARYAASSNIELAIAFGDLQRASKEAAAIAALDEPDARNEWQPYIANVRFAAERVAAAPDTIAAARASAELGKACAQCHEASSARIVFPPERMPVGNKLAVQMASHHWATARLWDGLIGPSPTSWATGARGLVDARIAIVAEGDVPPELGVADDVQRLHLHARRAQTAKTLDERATEYGEILATCAGCHRTIRD